MESKSPGVVSLEGSPGVLTSAAGTYTMHSAVRGVGDPIPPWQRKGENGGNGRFSDLGLQNHCGRDCSHEIKRHLLLSKGRTAVPNLDSMLKSRDITC